MVFHVVLLLLVLLASGPAWAQGAVSRNAAAFAGTFVGGPSVYSMAQPTPLGWSNTKGFRVCGAFPAAVVSGANAILSVEGQPGLPIHVQFAEGPEGPVTGGELVGTQCLTVNAAANAFVLDGVAGGIVANAASPHTVTRTEWAFGRHFVFDHDAELRFPDATTLSGQSAIIIQTMEDAQVRLVPMNNQDGFNGEPVSTPVEVLPNTTTLVTTSRAHGVHAFRAPTGNVGGPREAIPVVVAGQVLNGTAGTALSPAFQINATHNPTLYSVTPALPAALSLDASTGQITGTPAAEGIAVLSVTATNGLGSSPPVNMTINIVSAVASAPTVVPGTINGIQGVAISDHKILATNNPSSYAVVPNPPAPGLTLNPATGVITGTPTTAGDYPVQATATNGIGPSAQAALDIHISPPPIDCPVSIAFFARAQTVATVDTKHRAAYDNLICDLVADGTWAKLDALYVLATQSPALARLNLIQDNYNLTVHGAPVFVADEGYHGSVTSVDYLDTGFIGSGSTKFQLGEASITAWSLSAPIPTDTGIVMGVTTADTSVFISPHYNNNYTYVSLNTPAAANWGRTPSLGAVGAFGGTVFPVNQRVGYFNGGQPGVGWTSVGLAPAMANQPIYILARNGPNTPGVAQDGSPNMVSAVSIGGLLAQPDISSTGDLVGGPGATGMMIRLCTFLTTVRGACQ